MTLPVTDAKLAAVELWNHDPCGPSVAGEPGTLPYLQSLLAERRRYGPWMAAAFNYDASSGLRVLDVGSGQGIDLVEYASAGAVVTGIDLTPRHVELARQHLSARELPGAVVSGDAEALPFADHSFDKVSSNGVLHHTPDIAQALREMWRVLEPGGEAVVAVYHRDSVHYWLGQFLRRGVLQGGLRREGSMAAVLSSGVEESSIGARVLVRVYSRRQLRRLLEAAGFEQVTITVRDFKVPTFLRPALERAGLSPEDDSAVVDRIGRIAGWYVIGRARRPDRDGPMRPAVS